MKQTYRRQLYRDRHRLVLAGVLAVATAAMAHNSLPDVLLGIHLEVIVLYWVMLTVPLITLRFPRQRHLIEVILLGNFLYEGLGELLPGSYFAYSGFAGFQLPQFLTWIVTMVAARHLLYGRWADRFTNRIRLRAPALKLHSTASVEDLWYGLIPMPGQLHRHVDTKVISADWVDREHRTIRFVNWDPPRPTSVMQFHLSNIRFPHAVTLRYEVIEGRQDPALVDADHHITLADKGRYRVITVRAEGMRLPLRRVIRAYLDDTLGRAYDSRIVAIETAKACGKRPELCDRVSDWFDEAVEVRPADAPRRRAGDRAEPEGQSGSISPSARVA